MIDHSFLIFTHVLCPRIFSISVCDSTPDAWDVNTEVPHTSLHIRCRFLQTFAGSKFVLKLPKKCEMFLGYKVFISWPCKTCRLGKASWQNDHTQLLQWGVLCWPTLCRIGPNRWGQDQEFQSRLRVMDIDEVPVGSFKQATGATGQKLFFLGPKEPQFK